MTGLRRNKVMRREVGSGFPLELVLSAEGRDHGSLPSSTYLTAGPPRNRPVAPLGEGHSERTTD